MTSVLKVNNIQDSTGTSAMTIANDGQVSIPVKSPITPARPAFRAYDGTNGWVDITAATWTKLPLDTTDFNIGGHYSTANYEFTAPLAGLYHFTYQVYTYSHATSGQRNLRLGKNADVTDMGNNTNYILAASENPSGGLQRIFQCGGLFQLASGDKISPWYYHGNSITNDFHSDATSRGTFFDGYFVG